MRRDLEQLRSGSFDVIVIGGGMHGAWACLRAVQSGLSVALLECRDFGAATSSNSLNILHGGLRYLQHLDFVRMRSSIRARREFCRTFPRLVRPLNCLMPLSATGVRSPWILGPALVLNDLVAADRNSAVERDNRLSRGALLRGEACRKLVEPLAAIRANSGALWSDAVTTDPARLVLETVMMAADFGAVAVNRVRALEYLVHGGAVRGLAVRDELTGNEFEIRAEAVVNTAGPWAGELSRRAGLGLGYFPAAWVGGLNVVFRRSLGLEVAVALSSATKTADPAALLRRKTRELFFLPWHGATVVGTDYHPVTDLQQGLEPPEGAVERFIDEINRIAPRAHFSQADVGAVHWGLLPAEDGMPGQPVKKPVVAAGRQETGLDGLVVVISEKLTSAPTLSRHVVARLAGQLSSAPGGAASGRLRAPPAEKRDDQADATPGTTDGVDPQAVIRAIRHEAALGLDDLVIRRLGLCHAGHPGLATLHLCADLARREFGWSESDVERAVNDVHVQLNRRLPRSAGHAGSPR